MQNERLPDHFRALNKQLAVLQTEKKKNAKMKGLCLLVNFLLVYSLGEWPLVTDIVGIIVTPLPT